MPAHGKKYDDAMRTAEVLREAVRNFRFTWEERVFRLGASVGVVPGFFAGAPTAMAGAAMPVSERVGLVLLPQEATTTRAERSRNSGDRSPPERNGNTTSSAPGPGWASVPSSALANPAALRDSNTVRMLSPMPNSARTRLAS